MCSCFSICFILVLISAIYLVLPPDAIDILKEQLGLVDEDSCGCGDTDSPDSCNPIPLTRKSCCSVNPIIDKQIQAMQGGVWSWLKNKGQSCGGILGGGGGGEGPCLPNIGCSYVGASIASIRNTVPYRHPLATATTISSNTPENIIDDAPVIVGKNWHFTGVGTVVIKLFHPAEISGFSVSHPRACNIPVGSEKSAPKNFYVVGMNNLNEEPFAFGNFTYVIGGESTQTFPVKCCSEKHFSLIEFVFLSNHGNPDYTAVYKVKIHGVMDDSHYTPPKAKA